MADSRRKREADAIPAESLTWALLKKELMGAPLERPADSVTIAEAAAGMGLSEVRAGHKLKSLVKDGKMGVSRWRPSPDARPVLVYYALPERSAA